MLVLPNIKTNPPQVNAHMEYMLFRFLPEDTFNHLPTIRLLVTVLTHALSTKSQCTLNTLRIVLIRKKLYSFAVFMSICMCMFNFCTLISSITSNKFTISGHIWQNQYNIVKLKNKIKKKKEKINGCIEHISQLVPERA